MDAQEAKIYNVLGIDFGTSNSYFSDVRMGGATPSYADLKFHHGQSSVPTCVLYEREGENWRPHSFGETAIDLWKDLSEEERGDYRFRGGFKPDLAFDEQAYLDTVSFFRCIREHLEKRRLITHFDPDHGRQVVVGIPAKNVPLQEERTCQAVEEAGILQPKLVPEPEGALFYHLYYDRDRITVERAHEGVIVVDFGGGTLDIAYLQDCSVRQNWGSPMLGGRLFDDLFYQWFLEMHGGEELRQEMLDDGNLDFLRTFAFRHLKERFSLAWQDGQLARFRRRITMGPDYDYGVFRGATLEEFQKRARSYRLSTDLLHDLKLLDEDHLVNQLRQGSLDLFASIESLLQHNDGDAEAGWQERISAVILTGGSCRWPFMTELVQRAYPQAELFQSPDPEATISRGLGLVFAMKEYSQKVSVSLQQNKRPVKEQIFDAIHTAYRRFAEQTSQRLATGLFLEKIQPLFEEWTGEGGTLAELEERTGDAAQRYFEAQAPPLIEQEELRLQEDIQARINTIVFEWLQHHDVSNVEYLPYHFKSEKGKMQVSASLGGVLDDIFDTIKYVVTGIIGSIVASVAGGGGLALLISGPIGLLVGFLVGAAGTFLALNMIDTKQKRIPAWILKRFDPSSRLEKAQKEFQENLRRKFTEIFMEKESTLRNELEDEIDHFIQKISGTIPVTAILKD